MIRNKLRTVRLDHGLSLEDVAKEVGLTKCAYGNIESGRRNPSLNIAFNLEHFFGIPASELLEKAKSSIPEKRKEEKESNANQSLQ